MHYTHTVEKDERDSNQAIRIIHVSIVFLDMIVIMLILPLLESASTHLRDPYNVPDFLLLET